MDSTCELSVFWKEGGISVYSTMMMLLTLESVNVVPTVLRISIPTPSHQLVGGGRGCHIQNRATEMEFMNHDSTWGEVVLDPYLPSIQLVVGDLNIIVENLQVLNRQRSPEINFIISSWRRLASWGSYLSALLHRATPEYFLRFIISAEGITSLCFTALHRASIISSWKRKWWKIDNFDVISPSPPLKKDRFISHPSALPIVIYLLSSISR